MSATVPECISDLDVRVTVETLIGSGCEWEWRCIGPCQSVGIFLFWPLERLPVTRRTTIPRLLSQLVKDFKSYSGFKSFNSIDASFPIHFWLVTMREVSLLFSAMVSYQWRLKAVDWLSDDWDATKASFRSDQWRRPTWMCMKCWTRVNETPMRCAHR